MHTTPPFNKREQEFELGCRQLDALLPNHDLMLWNVDGHARELQDLVLRVTPVMNSLENRLDAQHQFPRAKRFGDIVVGA